MEWTQALSVIAALAALMGIQTFWIARALDRVEATLDRMDAKLSDQGERIAHLEGREPPSLRRV